MATGAAYGRHRSSPCAASAHLVRSGDRPQLGVVHGTIRKWLKLAPADPPVVAELIAKAELVPAVKPPPPPWHDWDQVRQVREDLRLYRTLFLHQSENLSAE